MRRELIRGAFTSALFVATLFAPGAWAEPSAIRHKHGKPPVEGVLNLNRASEAELQLLPGIGKGRAEKIVERRQTKPFASLEDVARIKGMRKLVQRLRPHLCVDGATTLRPISSAKPTGPPPDVH